MSHEISDKLIAILPEVLPRIYPLGTRQGKEFMIGNIMGEAGKSLTINLKTGVWRDHADPALKGKILGLFAARNGSFAAGMKEVAQLLKLQPPMISKKYKKPKVDWEMVEDDRETHKVVRYLIHKRKIPIATLIDSHVGFTSNEYVFFGRDESGAIAYAQYIDIELDDKGKKKVRLSLSPKLCLWGMDSVTEGADRLFITEGVMDALSMRAMGYNAVSIPGGSASSEWIELSWNFLSQYEQIFLCFDNDEPGQKAASHASGRLGTARCKNVRFKSKDANEALVNGEDITVPIAEAADFFPDLFVSGNDMKEKVWGELTLGPAEFSGDVLFGWKGKSGPQFRVRSGEVTLWTGFPGGGKSTMLLQHIAHSICAHGTKFALASLEIPPTTSLIRILTQACGFFIEDRETYDKAYQYIADHIFIYNCIGKAKVEDLLNFFEFCIARHGVTQVALDSIMRTNIVIDGDKAMVTEIFQTFIDSCTKTGAHYHIVAHAAKGKDTSFEDIPGMNSIKGVAEIPANADNVIVCWRNKPKEGSIEGLLRKKQHQEAMCRDQEWGDSRIVLCKNRYGQDLGTIETWFNKKNYRFREIFDIDEDNPYIALQ